ncbi:hypothetical protein [Frigoribacterium sp. UYMn621]|uniref:hypothetical protein n=1 Tax=Frigoribacterium sp. UYMn621 TaxID=3156343 RepID=UPI003398A175
MSETEPTTTPTNTNGADYPPAAITIAILWAVAALILGIVLLVNAKDEAYGGDAYTGIQNAVTWATRGIAFLLFGSGALGLVMAFRRDER